MSTNWTAPLSVISRIFQSIGQSIQGTIRRYIQRNRLKKEYLACRGTVQRKHLNRDLSNLQELIEKKRSKQEKWEEKLQDLKRKKKLLLRQLTLKQLVNQYFTNIKWIGDTYQKKIKDELEYVEKAQFFSDQPYKHPARQAAKRVKGLTDKSLRHIDHWFDSNQDRIQEQKQQVKKNSQKYNSFEEEDVQDARQKIDQFEEEIQELNKLEDTVSTALERFPKLDQRQYVQFRMQNLDEEKLRKDVETYVRGLFPPWQEKPDWYQTLKTCLSRQEYPGDSTKQQTEDPIQTLRDKYDQNGSDSLTSESNSTVTNKENNQREDERNREQKRTSDKATASSEHETGGSNRSEVPETRSAQQSSPASVDGSFTSHVGSLFTCASLYYMELDRAENGEVDASNVHWQSGLYQLLNRTIDYAQTSRRQVRDAILKTETNPDQISSTYGKLSKVVKTRRELKKDQLVKRALRSHDVAPARARSFDAKAMQQEVEKYDLSKEPFFQREETDHLLCPGSASNGKWIYPELSDQLLRNHEDLTGSIRKRIIEAQEAPFEFYSNCAYYEPDRSFSDMDRASTLYHALNALLECLTKTDFAEDGLDSKDPGTLADMYVLLSLIQRKYATDQKEQVSEQLRNLLDVQTVVLSRYGTVSYEEQVNWEMRDSKEITKALGDQPISPQVVKSFDRSKITNLCEQEGIPESSVFNQEEVAHLRRSGQNSSSITNHSEKVRAGCRTIISDRFKKCMDTLNQLDVVVRKEKGFSGDSERRNMVRFCVNDVVRLASGEHAKVKDVKRGRLQVLRSEKTSFTDLSDAEFIREGNQTY